LTAKENNMPKKYADGTWKLDMEKVKESLQYRFEHDKEQFMDEIKQLRTAVFVMCGGSLLGRMAASQPKEFYIDMRVGRLPYKRRTIEQAVKVLLAYLEVAGIDPRTLQDKGYSDFHNCGVF
jgi:hypothetical protein